ncbi:MAG TPA: hypothetical protein VGJ25_11505 [Gaiellaceae bacterium]|jgi:hypothetical protein
MPDPLQELLAAGAVPTTTFPPTSRYAEVGVDAWDPGNGLPPVPFLRRRLCPRPERFALLYEVRVVEDDRRDVLAARNLGDAELWWRLADANAAVDPRTLTDRIGRRLRITLAEGVPGSPDA